MGAFERLMDRVDATTAKRFGKSIIINEKAYVGVESHFLPEMGPINGDGISYVVFSEEYKPRPRDVVVADDLNYTVTRYQRFNGKWLIFVENIDDEGSTRGD
ncbi:ATP-binding protein [Providencia stuartii]|uniref:ATP-binding protein n=1 Tax=Providencia stuartii TaxID=588 RepID=UPI0024B13D01